MIKYFIGKVEINRGGGFCVETILFACYKTKPSKKLWQISQEWFPDVSEVDEKKQITYFNNWTVTVKPNVWMEVSHDTYKAVSPIIPSAYVKPEPVWVEDTMTQC